MRQNRIRRTDGTMRLGAGAGFAGDRFEPALDLVTHATPDVLGFEILAERTIALAHRRRRTGTGPGYDANLRRRIAAVLPEARRQGTLIITNGGAADPLSGGLAVRETARALGDHSCRIAVVTGDDITDRLDLSACTVLDTGEPLAAYRDRLISANAYLGIAPLLAALDTDPDIVIAGRTTDIALYLAPLVHAFDWALDDWARLAAGSVVGHLLECAGQLTGGYFADGIHKHVPDLARLGFPFADVTADGSATIAKLAGTGGRLDRATCLEQLLYEVTDPSAYLTPDVAVDFCGVNISEAGQDRIRIEGAIGRPPPATLKVSVGIDGGYTGTAGISYAGPGCQARAVMAAEIVRRRWREIHGRDPAALQADLVGITSCTPWLGIDALPDTEPPEARLRLAVQSFDRQIAADLVYEIEALYTNGPAGGGGVETSVRESVVLLSTLVPADTVTPRIEVLE
jgi:Acyclic terpene utilisation family protein AtuA